MDSHLTVGRGQGLWRLAVLYLLAGGKPDAADRPPGSRPVAPDNSPIALGQALFSATPPHAGWAKRCQRAFRQPHTGC